MKALTLHQPWASLVALGVKTVETRGWPTSHRGQLAIHAGTTRPTERRVGDWLTYVDGDGEWWITNAYTSGEKQHHPTPRGVIVAVCDLVDVAPMIDLETGEPDELHGISPNLLVFPDGRLVVSHHFQVPVRDVDVTAQRAYGDFAPGRYAWVLDSVFALDEPVPAKGRQGLWEWEPPA